VDICGILGVLCRPSFVWFLSEMFVEGGRESGREPCSQTLTYETPATAGKQATAGMLATVRVSAATGTPALSKGHQQEEAQPQKQKRQQQQDLCGKAIQVAGNEARNMALNVAVTKKFGGRDSSPSGRGFC
jgi:hypothetical protein